MENRLDSLKLASEHIVTSITRALTITMNTRNQLDGHSKTVVVNDPYLSQEELWLKDVPKDTRVEP
jgi:hypothetical protein